MKIRFLNYILFLNVLVIGNQSFAQKENLEKGDYYFNKRMYKEAIQSYKMALDEKIVFDKYKMTKRIAQTYKMLFEYEHAREWYEKLVKFTDKNEPKHLFDYGLLLCNLEQYDEAKLNFKAYFDAINQPDKYKYYEEICDWAILNKDKVASVNIYKSNIETGGRRFGVAFYKDGLVYSKPQKNGFDTKTVYYDLAYAKRIDTASFDTTMVLNGETNHSFYEGTPNFSSDYKTLYYSGNASEVVKYRDRKVKNKKISLSSAGVNILNVYEAKLTNGIWKNSESLSINNNEYDCVFPYMSEDGTQLFFASNMPNGFGGYDLYVSKLQADSTWGEPINLGANINSELDEMYPYINEDTLYFSSKGKKGFGGADIFKSYISNQGYSTAENLGKPYNSSKDDFSFIINNKQRKGYFSSNREGDNGYDYIYEFYIPELPDTINGLALNKITSKPIQGLEVKLNKVDSNGVPRLEDEFLTSAKGKVQLILPKHIEYIVTFYHPGFDPQTFEIPAENREDVVAQFGQLMFMPIPKKNDVIKIDNIYFDYNKSTIKKESFPVLDAIVEYLNVNSTIYVELSAHTDSRGSDSYNMNLSKKRAKSVVDYLLEKGISKSRLTPKGYGETRLVNKCGNNVKCSEEEHQQNRRVELKVL